MTEDSRLSFPEGRLSSVNDIISIGQTHPHSDQLGVNSKRQIQQWLEDEAHLLIDKKQRQRLKQIKLKQLQSEYEQKRELKHKQLDQKLSSSQKNKTKNIMGIRKKLSDVSKRQSSLLTKVHYDQEREIDKSYTERKVFEFEGKRPSSIMSNLSKSSESHFTARRYEPRDEEIERNIFQISSKLEKAKNYKLESSIPVLHKIQQHNNQNIKSHQLKANQQLSDQVSSYYQKIASKIENVESNRKQLDSSLWKKMEKQEKAYSERVRFNQSNLNSIEGQQAERLERLNKRFQEDHRVNKSWHNERDEAYHQRFLSNLSVLQEQKISRGDRIIQKHEQMRAKNRIYRERKESLFKAIKCDPSSG